MAYDWAYNVFQNWEHAALEDKVKALAWVANLAAGNIPLWAYEAVTELTVGDVAVIDDPAVELGVGRHYQINALWWGKTTRPDAMTIALDLRSLGEKDKHYCDVFVWKDMGDGWVIFVEPLVEGVTAGHVFDSMRRLGSSGGYLYDGINVSLTETGLDISDEGQAAWHEVKEAADDASRVDWIKLAIVGLVVFAVVSLSRDEPTIVVNPGKG